MTQTTWPAFRSTITRMLVTVALAATAAFSAGAEQLPETPPAGWDWSVTVRLYGTTDAPFRDFQRVFAFKSGAVPPRIEVVRPHYRDNEIFMRLDSPQHKKVLSEEDALAIYRAARSVVANLDLSASRGSVMDGTSLEVAVHSGDRQIAATFAHSSYLKSDDARKLMDTINARVPEAFRLR